MLNLVKNFWKELNKVRYIEISYGTEEEFMDRSEDEDSEKLHKELQDRIFQFQTSKRKLKIEMLEKYHIDLELAKTGILISKKEANKRAELTLQAHLFNGKLDYFYNFVS